MHTYPDLRLFNTDIQFNLLLSSPFVTWNQSFRLPDPSTTLVSTTALPLGASILLLGAASPPVAPNPFFLVVESVRCIGVVYVLVLYYLYPKPIRPI